MESDEDNPFFRHAEGRGVDRGGGREGGGGRPQRGRGDARGGGRAGNGGHERRRGRVGYRAGDEGGRVVGGDDRVRGNEERRGRGADDREEGEERRGRGRGGARGGRGNRGGGIRGARNGADDRRNWRDRHNERENVDDEIRGQRGGIGRGGGARGGRGRGGERGGRGRGGGRFLNYRQLQDLRSEDPSSIVMALGVESGLASLLKRQGQTTQMMFVLLEVLVKACSCTSAPESLFKIILAVHNSKFYECVSETLTNINTRAGDNGREKREFIKNILLFLKQLSMKLPHSFMSYQVLGLLSFLDAIIHSLEMRSDIIDDEILQMLEEMDKEKTTMIDRIQKGEKKEEVENPTGGPPNDYREVPIFPNAEDINPDQPPYLRKNIAHGGYRDLDHYLDVQFRLLREDFICPLRDGIDEYQAASVPGTKGQKLKDIRVYHDVQIMRTVCSDSGLLHRITFDVSKFRRVRWENSKRLIFGSLVCLSHDNFDTFLFATVADRDPKKLKDGIIDVLFENVQEIGMDISLETRFVMVETTAYFEAYRHVLRGLQMIRPGDLPFENYIVACESQVRAPRYLRTKVNPMYDLRPLVDDKIVLREDASLRGQGRQVSYNFSRESKVAESIEILDHREWPSAKTLHLDLSQYQALKTALTKEFVITQGPPGTGKTYVGLKIVKALLHNAQMWNREHRSPMLIVCYTNHALDQFLEGILDYFKGSIIRVGGRMTSEKLEPCSLKNQRQRARKEKTRDLRNTGRMRWEIRQDMMNLKLEIERKGQQIEAAEREILHEDTLQPFMDQHYEEMTMTLQVMLVNMQQQGYAVQPPRSAVTEWLGLGTIEGMGGIAGHAPVAGEEEEEEEDRDGDDHVEVQEEADIIHQQRRLEEDDDVFEVNELDLLKKQIDLLPYEKETYVAFDVTSLDKQPSKKDSQNAEWQMAKEDRKRLKRKILKKLRSTNRMTEHQVRRVRDVWGLQVDERWRLYRYWVHQLCQRLQTDVREKETQYRRAVVQYKESQMIEDKQVLQTATVIGMTTTGAARHQQILAEIGPKIIVVEEAAEVLEGHIITTLSSKCEHLILIGDHKQLKPNPTVYNLAKNFNLDLSMFERMINNGVQCDTLALQHRMRPEIAVLMKHIYPKLENHSSVLKYDSIKGVSENIFFINHGYEEEHDNESRSHSNHFEAVYIVALCEYLLKQGYERSHITILTAYSGQLFKLKKMMPKEFFQGVRLTAVDNFQGEENDIILLSLVRSNSEGSVGFLKIENRVCVALSRAKKGLYVIGNFDLLAQQSQLWKEMVKDMKRDERFGTKLKLYCQNHPRDAGIEAGKPEDFQKAPEGGCMKPCMFRLDCGHVCTRPCHPYDVEHEEYKCPKPCSKKVCENDHPCRNLCYQKCEKCQVPIEKTIPTCGHQQMVPCSQRPSTFICHHDCEKVLKCGHRCGNICGVEHFCRKKIMKTWRCGHTKEIECGYKDTAVCTKRCSQILKCEHQCAGNCDQCHEGRLHIGCRSNCKRPLVCSHECTDRCSYCPPCKRACENRCAHSRCFKKCGDACPPCNEPCTWQCEHYVCTKRCSEPCNRPPCNEPCQRRLRCGHPCIGLCGEPCPRLCRICNAEEVTTIMFGTEDEPDARFVRLEDCSHIVEVTALDKFMDIDYKSDTLKLKVCPFCKTPIRRNVRYGTAIKAMLQDIEKVKERHTGKAERIQVLKAELDVEVEREVDMEERKERETMLRRGYNHTEQGLIAIKNQFRFLKRVSKVFDAYEKLGRDTKVEARSICKEVVSYMKELEKFRKWLMISRFSLSEQEQSDAQMELLRHKALVRVITVEKTMTTKNVKLPPDLEMEHKALQGILKYGKPFTEERRGRAKAIFERLKEHVPESGLGLSEEERVQVVQAMGLAKGHWYKCPNGHIYAIGDCGGATVESKCPECAATIGGGGHRLRADNALATEMDGARYAAWSEQANMGNFNLDDLH